MPRPFACCCKYSPMRAIQLPTANRFFGIPALQNVIHHYFYGIQIHFRLERIVNSVVPREEKLVVSHFFVVTKMRAAGSFHQAVSHQRAGGNNRFHDAGLNQVAKNQAHLANGHAPERVITMKQSLSRAMASRTSAASPI